MTGYMTRMTTWSNGQDSARVPLETPLQVKRVYHSSYLVL